MPLVLEAKDATHPAFLHEFLTTHSSQILEDIAQYGAVLLRGFTVSSESAFEKAMLSIKGIKGIGDAFMSEEGRIPVDDLKYVLHTNAVYKTGGTLYLGGFHSENYYSPDVPGYIFFCCFKPSLRGGETGLINMSKVYQKLPPSLKEKFHKNPFFVSKWRLSEVADRYQISEEKIAQLCKQFDLPVVGEAPHQFILMYKPSIFKHPTTHQESLQINFFEVERLNEALRQCFTPNYQGQDWFWHRAVWRLPRFIFKGIELIYMGIASLIYSPKQAWNMLKNKMKYRQALNKNNFTHDESKVGSCFTPEDVKTLARAMRESYCSCLWKQGDILLIDNRQVVHAGMPGAGSRTIRAMIGNPLEMSYSMDQSGSIECKERIGESVGFYAAMDSIIENSTSNAFSI